MARMTTTRTSTKAPTAQAGAKRLGRPLGSKNKVSSMAKIRTAATATRRTAPKKSAVSVAPKMSKADLELHVAKLERSIARLRKQNAELKQTTHDDVPPPPVAKVAPKATASVKPKRAIASKTRRKSAKNGEGSSASSAHADPGDDMLADD